MNTPKHGRCQSCGNVGPFYRRSPCCGAPMEREQITATESGFDIFHKKYCPMEWNDDNTGAEIMAHDPFAAIPSPLEAVGGPNDGDMWNETFERVCGAFYDKDGHRHSPVYQIGWTAKGQKAYIFTDSYFTTPTPPTK